MNSGESSLDKAQSFAEHRPLLFGIAWRMLGNSSDAEDILQDAFLRWQKIDQSVVRSPRSFLVTVVTRLCLNHLDRAHVRHEVLGADAFLQELPSGETNPANDADLAEALDAAFTVMLRCLSPIERAVFLLREVFDRDYAEISRIVEKSEDNCRQIVRRARSRVAGQEPRFVVDAKEQDALLREFLNASNTGDVERLATLLASDATLLADGANLGVASPAPVEGRTAVCAALLQQLGSDSSRMIETALLGDLPILFNYVNGSLASALAFAFRQTVITTIYRITCPVRLRSLAAQCGVASRSDGPSLHLHE
jgi:RNA polymerase sigma-70 factor (ECF subfamily)